MKSMENTQNLLNELLIISITRKFGKWAILGYNSCPKPS